MNSILSTYPGRPPNPSATQRPAPGAPIMEALSNSSVRVHFAAVPGDTHAVVYIHVLFPGNRCSTRFSVDGLSGKIVPFGQRACTFTCADGNCCVIVGLSSDSTCTATIRSREPNAVDWGPESPHSQPLSLCNASHIPGAPVAGKHGEDAILIRWAVPYGTTNVALFVWLDRDLNLIDCTTGALMKFGTPGVTGWPVTLTQCLMKGLSDGKYKFMIACYNGVLWGACSPHSSPVWITCNAEVAQRHVDIPSHTRCHITPNVDGCRGYSQLDVESTAIRLNRRKYHISP